MYINYLIPIRLDLYEFIYKSYKSRIFLNYKVIDNLIEVDEYYLNKYYFGAKEISYCVIKISNNLYYGYDEKLNIKMIRKIWKHEEILTVVDALVYSIIQ